MTMTTQAKQAITEAGAANRAFALRNPTMEGPWQWLAAGWRDMWRTPAYSLSYGLAFVAIGLAGTAGLWEVGLEALVPAIGAGFALLGPILAVGLYEISRRYESGEALDVGPSGEGVCFWRGVHSAGRSG